MIDGQPVCYVGPPEDGLAYGDVGRILTFANADYAHTLFTTGARARSVVAIPIVDLTLIEASRPLPHPMDDSLEVGGLSTIAAREIVDNGGSEALLDTMAEAGHLASFADYAEQALSLVAAQVRVDPSFREVCAQLDDDEGEDLIRLASVVIIRDAFAPE